MKMGEVVQSAPLTLLEKLYITVYSQAFSPCGKFLAVGTNNCHIAIYNLSQALGRNAGEDQFKPLITFTAHEGSVFSLVTHDKLLLSGDSHGVINAWKWTELCNSTPKVVWSVSVPSNDANSTGVMSLVIDAKDSGSLLYAGCGDDSIHVWDLQTGTLLKSYQGHTDYIHSIALRNDGKEVISASEDGTVRIWDTRAAETMHILEPYRSELCARPQIGKWLTCVAVDPTDDWLVCGGGPTLSLWHLRSLTPTTLFDTPGVAQQFVTFYDDTLISAGSAPQVNHWFINGESKSKVPCSSTSVCTLNVNSNANKVLCVAGTSDKIDVYTNFGYKAFSLVL